MVAERRATLADINRLIEIRRLVIENRLAEPATVTRADYEYFIGNGRVWVSEIQGKVAGFSASDGRDGSVWALFVDPAYEGQGFGSQLLSKACQDLKADGYKSARLSTDTGTKAAALYRKLGWKAVGLSPEGEMQFQLMLAPD